MGDTTTTTTQTKKKRSRVNNSPDSSGDDGKKRGRPRVEKQDESAADRRRTQIRMAQRAYRQRKESTLEELRKRVSELTNTLELMNKAFVDCRDRLTTAGLPEAQYQDLVATSKQFETLMKCARNPGEEPDPDVTQSLHRPSTSSGTGDVTMKDIEPKNVPSWIDEAVFNHSPKPKSSTQIGMGYEMFMQNDMQEPAFDYANHFDQRSSTALTQQKNPHPNSLDAFRVEISDSTSIPSAITPPMTYSFQETTFARRLHRSCLEQGYQLLLDPQRRPQTYDRVFKLSLLSRDRSKLITAMKTLLDKGPHERLDFNAPLIHVGGAGTHYPRRDQYGNLQPKKESWNLGVVGPQTLALLENAARDNLTTDMTVDIAGFEGEWFDPYDVEGYLNEKGIYIDPSTSFAEAEVLVWSSTSTPSNTISSGASPQTPTNNDPLPPARPFDNEQVEYLNRGDNFEQSEWNENDMLNILNMSDIGFSDADTGSWMNFLQPGQSVRQLETMNITPWEGSKGTEFLPQDGGGSREDMFARGGGGKVQQKRVIIIDVAKFVKVMTVSGVCIGRTPGFKRKDVDRALALASFDAF